MTVNWYDSPEFAEFDEIWCEDGEWIPAPGEHPDVLCWCALELRTGRRIELWDEQITSVAPFRTDKPRLARRLCRNRRMRMLSRKERLAASGATARPLPDVSLLHQRPQGAAGR